MKIIDKTDVIPSVSWNTDKEYECFVHRTSRWCVVKRLWGPYPYLTRYTVHNIQHRRAWHRLFTVQSWGKQVAYSSTKTGAINRAINGARPDLEEFKKECIC